MRETKNAHRSLTGKPFGENHFEDQEGYGKITLRRILEKYVVR
jgi:hypothetical protein